MCLRCMKMERIYETGQNFVAFIVGKYCKFVKANDSQKVSFVDRFIKEFKHKFYKAVLTYKIPVQI